jgi:hypothetical protein
MFTGVLEAFAASMVRVWPWCWRLQCKHLWNVGKLLPDRTAQQPRIQPCSYSLPWERKMSLIPFHIRTVERKSGYATESPLGCIDSWVVSAPGLYRLLGCIGSWFVSASGLYRLLGCIDSWVVSAPGLYRFLGCIDSWVVSTPYLDFCIATRRGLAVWVKQVG